LLALRKRERLEWWKATVQIYTLGSGSVHGKLVTDAHEVGRRDESARDS